MTDPTEPECEDCKARRCFDCGRAVRKSDLGRVSYDQLVEMHGQATRRAITAERALRDRYPDDIHIVLAQQARIEGLEANIKRLIDERARVEQERAA